MAALLANVPASRLFDEMIKLLQTGHALASMDELRKQGLQRGVFPILDALLDRAQRHEARERFVQLALADTDRRVAEGQAGGAELPARLPAVARRARRAGSALQAAGEPPFPALQQAIDAVFDARIGDISGRGKLAADMREIWLMQPRFERRSGNTPCALVEQPRFRAGFDFLRLRADAGEVDAELADWWEDFALGDDDEREALLQAVREQQPPRRVPARAAARAGAGRRRPRCAGDEAAAAQAAPPAPQAAPARRAPMQAAANGRQPSRTEHDAPPVRAFVGLGANLGDARPRCARRLQALGRLPRHACWRPLVAVPQRAGRRRRAGLRQCRGRAAAPRWRRWNCCAELQAIEQRPAASAACATRRARSTSTCCCMATRSCTATR